MKFCLENTDQPNAVRAMVLWGHAPNSQTRGPEMKKAMEKLDLLVVIDPLIVWAIGVAVHGYDGSFWSYLKQYFGNLLKNVSGTLVRMMVLRRLAFPTVDRFFR